MTRALTASRINPGEIDYVCAAANGGWRSDRLEAEALSRVFATSGSQPRISALKGSLGESFSSGGIRAAAMALSIQNQTLAPTLGVVPAADASEHCLESANPGSHSLRLAQRRLIRRNICGGHHEKR